MRSKKSQFFHDHVLVKEPYTMKPTPWHSDMPYYFIKGKQNVSMWIPMDDVEKSKGTLRFIAGSHKWEKMVLPVRWNDNSDFYDSKNNYNLKLGKKAPQYEPVPNSDADSKYKILEWNLNVVSFLKY